MIERAIAMSWWNGLTPDEKQKHTELYFGRNRKANTLTGREIQIIYGGVTTS